MQQQPQQQQPQRPPHQAPSAAPPAASAAAQMGPFLMAGDVVLSSEFQGWCRAEMQRFFGHNDLSLVEVLVTLPSRSEVADYCSMFMEGKPGKGGGGVTVEGGGVCFIAGTVVLLG